MERKFGIYPSFLEIILYFSKQDQLFIIIIFVFVFVINCFGFLLFCLVINYQLEGEEAQRVAKRRLERERGRKEATADMSEDLSEGEKGDVLGDISAHGDIPKGRMKRINSVDVMENWAKQQKEKKFYIVLIRHETKHFLDCHNFVLVMRRRPVRI